MLGPLLVTALTFFFQLGRLLASESRGGGATGSTAGRHGGYGVPCLFPYTHAGMPDSNGAVPVMPDLPPNRQKPSGARSPATPAERIRERLRMVGRGGRGWGVAFRVYEA